MPGDARALLRPFAASVRLYLAGWARSRAPWLWLLFLAVWVWMDRELRAPSDAAWWTNWVALAAMVGFLAGYDAYLRLREDASLRLLLLQGAPRIAIALAFIAGGAMLTGGVLLLFAAYLVGFGGVAVTPGLIVGFVLVWCGSLGFVAYAQLGSLLLPRDTAAVLGLLLVIFGFGPWDRWLPAATPELLRAAVQVGAHAIPTAHRLGGLLAGDWLDPGLLLVIGQIAAATLAIRRLLERTALLARRHDA